MKNQKSNARNAAVNLRLDWCSYQAAKYAVEHWHYSKTMPKSKLVSLGVWENNLFIGAIIFGLGGGAACDGSRYGLAKSFQMAELQRVALNHHNNQTSRIITIACHLLRHQSPGLRLLISYADPRQGHHGGIYQACGWIYTGRTADDWKAIFPDGKEIHSRVAGNHKQYGCKRRVDISQARKIIVPGKHRYLMPLDTEMRYRIESLRKSYPKRAASETIDTLGHQPREGGEAPTAALQD